MRKITKDNKGAAKIAAAVDDANVGFIRELALELYVITGNKAASYDMYRRATLLGEYEPLKNKTIAFFDKTENATYIEARKKELMKSFFDMYCRENNIEHKDFVEKRNREIDSSAGMTPDEIRDKNYRELEEIKMTTYDEVLKANIIKQQTELMNAKLKKEEDEVISDDNKLIFFYLPAPVCDTCPNRSVIENKYANRPHIDLDFDDDESEEDE